MAGGSYGGKEFVMFDIELKIKKEDCPVEVKLNFNQ
jgi:hypothetical protein